ncbi:MAG: acyl-CoA mutase large subunit family protein [Candidatus Syntropharchaeia archaeon]
MENEIKEAEKKWEEKVRKALEKYPERKKKFLTDSGIPVKRIYTPLDVKDLNYNRDLGFPGDYPFTRGVQPTMYRGRIWTMRQYAGYGTAKETNERYKYLIEQGQTGLSVAFDLPTQMGYDSDHPMASGEVGKVGVAVDHLSDMETVFDGIPLDKVSTSMTINAPTAMILSMYIVTAQKQGISSEKLAGTVQNDILKEYVARGTYIYPPEPSIRLVADVITYCAENLPKWNSINIAGYHFREAGCNAVQEIAFTFSDGFVYIESVLERGMDIDSFAPRLSFIFNTYNNFFEEIAKYRAARRIWARALKERYGAKNPRSMMFRTHMQTGGSTLTAQQPENNIIRATIQTLAAVLGGVQSIAVSCMDEAIAIPSEKAVRTALRTQQIIAYESGVTDTIDPLGGSYYVEWLTDEIEERAMREIEKIDEMGGMLKAIESGYINRAIEDNAYAYQKEIESGERIVVGVNKFTVDEEPEIEILEVDPAVEEVQKEKLKRIRKERDRARLERALDGIRKTAEKEATNENNLIPPIIEAIKADATLGEMCDVLREVFGVYKVPVTI